MIHIPLHERLPELAERESRTLSISNSPHVPDGDYALLESYCEESDCDCRRVFLSVCSRRRLKAVIAFGWEDREFYARWMGTRDRRTVDGLKGPCLNLASPQSRLAPVLLDLVREALKDEAYVERIKRHYALFKESLRKRPGGRNDSFAGLTKPASGARCGTLPEAEERRFFGIWWPLLGFVNQKRRFVPDWPKQPGRVGVDTANAGKLRDALWQDDALRESFIASNPAGLSGRDLEIVASWKRRIGKSFIVVRHLKGHSVFLDESPPSRAYGVCGLYDPIEKVVGSRLPVAVEAVLLPFEGRIVYDGLMKLYPVTFGPGMRKNIAAAYRRARESGGIVTRIEETVAGEKGAGGAESQLVKEDS